MPRRYPAGMGLRASEAPTGLRTGPTRRTKTPEAGGSERPTRLPNVTHAPNESAESWRPDEPSRRYSMRRSSSFERRSRLTDDALPCFKVGAPLHFASLHWGVADRSEMPRDARQHTWRTRHGARDDESGETFGFLQAMPGPGRLQRTIASITFPARRSHHANVPDFDGHRRARRNRRQDAAAVADPRREVPQGLADLPRHLRGDARQSRDRGLGRGARCGVSHARDPEMDRRTQFLLGRALDAEAGRSR